MSMLRLPCPKHHKADVFVSFVPSSVSRRLLAGALLLLRTNHSDMRLRTHQPQTVRPEGLPKGTDGHLAHAVGPEGLLHETNGGEPHASSKDHRRSPAKSGLLDSPYTTLRQA